MIGFGANAVVAIKQLRAMIIAAKIPLTDFMVCEWWVECFKRNDDGRIQNGCSCFAVGCQNTMILLTVATRLWWSFPKKVACVSRRICSQPESRIPYGRNTTDGKLNIYHSESLTRPSELWTKQRIFPYKSGHASPQH